MRRFSSVLLAVILATAIATPVMAYVLNSGWFYTGAIDTDSNGQADLSVCYGVNLYDLVYVNRGDVEQEIEQWHTASFGNFTSNGICNNDGSNIEMLYADFGPCEPGSGIYAGTQNLGNVGYASKKIWFNTQCLDDFDWYDADGIDPGYVTALGVALHEVGHALGLSHSAVNNAVMNEGGPNNCSEIGNDFTLALDDANGYRARYPGINDTGTSFPTSAGCVN